MSRHLACLLRRWADRMDQSGKPHRLPAHTFTIEPDGIRFRTDGQGAQLHYVGEGEFAKASTPPSISQQEQYDRPHDPAAWGDVDD